MTFWGEVRGFWGSGDFLFYVFKGRTCMKKSFAFTRLLPSSNSKTEHREREPHLTDGKTEAKRRRGATAS